MDFKLSEEQVMLRESVKNFMKKECPPDKVRIWDESHQFPLDVWRKMGKIGWLGLPIPEEYGGIGGSMMDIITFSEELSYGMTGLSAAFQRSACYGGSVITQVGSEEQKREYLPRLSSGEIMFAISLTEPNSGSDAASLKTIAIKEGEDYFISGQKIFTSGADISDYYVVATRTNPDVPNKEGITTFIIPRDADGIEFHLLDKLGNWTISTAQVYYDNVRVPKNNILGELNQGWQTTLSAGLIEERLVIGAHCTGSAQRALDVALEYAKQRVQFGKPIGRFQMIQQKLSDMACLLQASRLMTYHAAWLFDNGLPCRKESSMAKLYASEAWNKIAYEAIQVLGGNGYMMEYELQRQYRDARLYTIGGGTSEIQRLIIAHEMQQGS